MNAGPRVLMVGPLPRPGTSVGGTQVSFDQLVRDLRSRGHVQVLTLDTTRSHVPSRGIAHHLREFVHAVSIASSVYRQGRTCDVVLFNASADGFLLGGPLVWLATRMVGRPIIARAFGGGLDEALARKNPMVRALAASTILRSQLVLLQTRGLCEHFADRAEVRHLPTTRRAPQREPRASRECRRFLMLAQLRPEKGYREAIEAIRRVPENCSLTIAGPAMPDTEIELLKASPRVTWLGEIAPDKVSDLLAQHDALILPTYHAGEGLPGSIIEAFQHGLPVIATRWRAIPELVIPAVNGLLVEPRDVSSLAQAMQRLASEPTLFVELRDGALATGLEHSSDDACSRVERWLSQVSHRPLALLSARERLEHVPAPLPRRQAPTEVES